MHIEDLKRWHWIVISLVVGAVLSWVYSSSLAEGGAANSRTIGPSDFLSRAKTTTRDQNNQVMPYFRNVRVYPPLEAKQVVTLEELQVTVDRATKKRSYEYQPRQFIAEIPFAFTNRQPEKPNWTILDELNKRKIDHSYAAWASKPMVFGIGMGGSFVLIGLIWPTIQNRLQRAGLGPPVKEKKQEIDLSKVKSGRSAPTKAEQAIATGPTQADLEQLEAVNAQYERNVGGMTVAAAGNAGAKSGSAVMESPARKWDAAPTEPATGAAPNPPEDHDYRGEFYPVDRGPKKA